MAHHELALSWSFGELGVNLAIFINLVVALLLGALVGYERAYHGRAAGMRTYGLVCMAAAGLVSISGYPAFWYSGQLGAVAAADPTRVIQGIVTGIGFLGAGVIMKEGLNISGLSTAASIWASSAIGVLVGVSFYVAAILLTLLAAASMMWMGYIENRLPAHPAIDVILHFAGDFQPDSAQVEAFMCAQGYAVVANSLRIDCLSGEAQWHFVAIASGSRHNAPLTTLAKHMSELAGVRHYHLSFARN